MQGGNFIQKHTTMMKRKIILVMALLYGCLMNTAAMAQGKAKNTTADKSAERAKVKTILKGEGITSDKKFFYYMILDEGVSRSYQEYQYMLDSVPLLDGAFEAEININHPVYIQAFNTSSLRAFNVHSARYYPWGFLMEPGDSITVSSRLPDSITYIRDIDFNGRGAAKNHCIQSIISNCMAYDCPVYLNSKDFNKRLANRDSVERMILGEIDRYKPKLSAAAISVIKAHYIPMLVPDFTELMREAELNLKDEKVKALFYKQLEKNKKIFDPADPNLVYSINNLSSTFARRAKMQYAIEKEIEYPKVFNQEVYAALKKYIPEGAMKPKTLAWLIKLEYDQGVPTKELKMITEQFLREINPSNPFYRGIKDLYDTYNQRLSAGAPVYSFDLPDTLGNRVKMENFKGKVVLLDFMFSGCGGCVAMVPHLAKVEEHYKGNPDVVFISVSVDKDKTSSIREALQGIYSAVPGSIYLFTDGKSGYHPIIKHYDISAYPTLVLIDKQGKLVTARAPRPDRDEGKALKALIDQAIQSK
jgi:thiol-disulfide isomerase/thioredoxin